MNMKISALAPVAALALAATTLAHGDNITCTITTNAQNELVVPVVAISGGVQSPYDLGSGLPTGKRQHRPLAITKLLDGVSPQLFQAAVTNQTLASVECSFYRPGPRKTNELYFRITLTNARIVDLAIESSKGIVIQESMQLVWQQITLEDPISGTAATDNWSQPET
jgi:type VI secretion system secreted protein Hcp